MGVHSILSRYPHYATALAITALVLLSELIATVTSPDEHSFLSKQTTEIAAPAGIEITTNRQQGLPATNAAKPPVETRASETRGDRPSRDSARDDHHGWRISKGYFATRADYEFYQSLDKATLHSQLEQGDVLAMRTLGKKYLDQRPAFASGALLMNQMAATLGSTPALIAMASIYADPHSTLAQPVGNEVHAMRVSADDRVNEIAFVVLADLRGDPVIASRYLHQRVDLDDYPPVVLLEACAGAKTLYTRLEQAREKIGHAEFDNARPPTRPAGSNRPGASPAASLCGY